MDLYDELQRLLDLLQEAEADYALCGGLAVAFHGYARFTKDIDLMVRQDDVARITDLVRELDFTITTGPMPFGHGTDRAREVHRISKLGDEVLTLDLVVVSPALEAVWADREVFEWQGRHVTVVSADGLATMKRMAGRDQDLLDLRMLGFEEDGEAEEDR